jgi:GH25 family lysozyme M1 (1,4-beta-N-acetylmuramidase)
MRGLLGLNTRTLSVSRDMEIAALRQSGGAYHLIEDDPTLAAQAKAEGFGVVYRQSGDDANGNPIMQDPGVFVGRRAQNAPTADFLHLSNELDVPTLALLSWTRAAMQYADRIGRKVCLFNFSTNRDAGTWNVCEPLIKDALAGGHAIGLHAYFDTDPEHDAGAWAWKALQAKYGGRWLVTEFAYIRDIRDGGKGWHGAISQTEYAAFLQAYVRLFAALNMPLMLFSFDDWMPGSTEGFGIHDAPEILASIASINAAYPLKEPPVPVPIPDHPPIPAPTEGGVPATLTHVPALFVNLRAQPGGAIIGDLRVGETFTTYPTHRKDEWLYVARDGDGAHGWVSTQGGNVTFTPVTPAPASIIDVSQAQGVIDWPRVKAAGVKTAILRASQGLTQVDTRFVTNANAALAAGLEIGVYHALIASSDGAKQAVHFLKTIEAFREDLALPLVIDVELQNGQSPKQIADTLFAMAEDAESATGQLPMLYTSSGFFNGQVGGQHDEYFADLPLWIAHWTKAAKPLLPRCWHDYAYWQYSDKGKIDGIQGNVDLSRKR